jgi:3'-phosphoadenosine 5'-phosphosulfate sulfotransferase (PAPS reductase)/FAD synthetase
MRECAEKTAEQLDVDLDITEPELNIWDWLATSLPRGASLMDEPSHLAFRKQFSCGNLLVAYQYAHGFAGSYSGMRAEESRGRRMNRKIRGPLYQLRSDDTWACLPIVDWSARDVFACLVQLGLPIHPHYRLLSDRLGISPESPASRVDCMIPEDRVTKMPAGLQCKLLYPELWRRIITVRPELSAHGG